MTTRYRLLDDIDWPALQGKRYTVDVNPSMIVLIPTKAGEPLLIIAQAIKPRAGANGQPEPVPVTSTEE